MTRKCLETRRRDGLTWRRYRDADGVIHRTVEIPLSVWRFLNHAGRGNDRVAAYERVHARIAKRVEALRRVAEGGSLRAIARGMDLPESTVRRWAKGAL